MGKTGISLDTALADFATAFAAGSDNFGAVEFRSPEPVVEPIPLGPILRHYYARLRLIDKPMVAGALHLGLFTLDQLETAQHGWRWVRDKGGPVTDNPTWNKHWIIIADRHGDAICVDDSTLDGVVWGSIMQRNFKIADDLGSFFQVMAQAITLESITFAYDVHDDDFNVYPNFLDAVHAVAVRVLGSEGAVGFKKFFFE